MFVYSVRAGAVKLLGLVLLVLTLVGALVFFGSDNSVSASTDGTISFEGIKTEEDRISFIERFGLRVDKESRESSSFPMPEDFDRVIAGYNEIQKRQGLDLSKYARKKVTRFTYRVENYDWDGEVYATLFIYRSRIVACDISSADPAGFVLPLTLVDSSKIK